MSKLALFPLFRLAPAVAAIALTAIPAASAQESEPPEGFSIFAPGEEAEQAEPETPAAVEAAPAAEAPAGAWLDREAYLARRGERSQDVLRTRWRIVTTTLDGEEIGTEQREIVVGDGYVAEPGGEERMICDFATGRILTRTQTLDGPVMRSRPIVAHVHRQMDTFTYYTQGGELEEVTGPGGAQFERFWIEAAMGVRLAEVEMTVGETEDDHVAVRRSELGSEIFGFDRDGTGEGAPAALFRAWMRHALPIHPDALRQLDPETGIPQRFSFLVFSPTSPEGRRETWIRASANEGETAFPWPEGLPPAGADSYETADPAIGRLLAAGFAALTAPAAAAPTEETFLAAAEAAQRRADPAGAYLALYQTAHHFGPCRGRPDSPICSRMSQVTASGLGNDDFEALMAALSEMQDDRPAAVETLRLHLHREGLAGAAANMLAAQAVAAAQAVDADALADLAPLDLFADAAGKDPYAALAYWHAGRYAAGMGDIDSAWQLFDIARAMPSSQDLPPAREAVAMHEQLRALAPGFFGPDAAR